MSDLLRRIAKLEDINDTTERCLAEVLASIPINGVVQPPVEITDEQRGLTLIDMLRRVDAIERDAK